LLQQLQRAVEALPVVGRSLSVLDMDRNYSGGGGTAPSRWMDDDGQRLRVSWAIPVGSARDIGVMERRILATATEQLPEGVVLRSSGYLPLYNRLVDHLLSDQLSSLAIAVLSVFGIMGLLLRQLRVMIYALAVNLLPLCSLLALMSLAGVPLDIATITVAPAMLGLIVDDSIHWLYHYDRCRADGLAVVTALEQTNRTIGSTLVSTSIILVLGFGILGFAGINSIATNGLLMAFTVLIALLTDLLLLPVLIAVVEKPGT
jgi:predicted RND superfamily exporter protein